MIKRLIIFIAIVSLLFVSCKKDEEFASEETQSQFEGLYEIDRNGWEIGKPGGRFVAAVFGSDPKTLNIALSSESSTSDVLYNAYDRLNRRNQLTMEWEPAIAESWTLSDDGMTATYKIREGLKWSDGMPLTAYDFEFAINEVYLNEAVDCNYRGSLIIDGVPSKWIALDEHTLQVSLHTVYAGLQNTANQFPLPKHIFEKLIAEEGIEAVNSFWGVDTDVTEIVSYGQFILTEYVPSQKVVFKKNPNYYEKDAKGQSLPYLDELILLILDNQDTALAKFLGGEADWIDMRGEDYAILLEKMEERDLKMYNVGPSSSTNFVAFNMNPKALKSPQLDWLDNKDFRLAMSHLVDRETITKNVVYGFGSPQYSFVPRVSPYYWEDVDNQAPKYDPEKAKKILDDLGYTDKDGDGWREDDKGNKITLTMLTNAGNREREAIGEIYAQEAKKIGIDLTFKPEDFNTLVGRLLTTYDWELILLGLTGSVDPISGANVYPSKGNLHMNHPLQETPVRDWERRADEAWIEANHTMDEAQRKSGYQKLQQIWIEENPWVYTFNKSLLHAYSGKFGNVKPQPVDDYEWKGTLRYLYIKE